LESITIILFLQPAQCEKCDGLKSDIASLIGKVIEKDIQVSALGKLLALKDEEISRLKSQQNPQLREMIAHKDKKLSRLEDQQLLTDTRMNKLRADIDFVLKEFDEAVKINEEGSDKYSDRSLNKSEKHERLAPTIGIANRHDDKPQSTTPLPHTYERSPPYFPT
jgi:chromosome segregation ATPase